MNFILPFFRFSLVLDGKPPNVTEIVKLCNLEIQQMVDETTTTAAGGTPYSKYVIVCVKQNSTTFRFFFHLFMVCVQTSWYLNG